MAQLLRATGLSTSSHHKNIAYRPVSDKVTASNKAMVQDPDELRAVMRAYSQRVLEFLRTLSPATWKTAALISQFPSSRGRGRDFPRKSATIYCMWMPSLRAPPAAT